MRGKREWKNNNNKIINPQLNKNLLNVFKLNLISNIF